MIDRFAIVSLAAMYALFPLYGTFVAFVPHPPTAPLVPRSVALAIVAVMLLANLGVTIGAIRKRVWPTIGTALVANVVATYLGAFFGFDPGVGIGLATGIAGFVAAHVALIAYYRTPSVARIVYFALLTSGLLAALLAIGLLVLKTPVDLYAFNHGRAIGTFLNPNELAEYLLVYVSAAGGLAIVRRGTTFGTYALVCAAVGSLALALTFSRWGLVSAFVGIVAYALAMRPRRGLALIAGALVLAVALNVGLWTRHHDPQDTGVRWVAWRAGLTTFLHFPLTGAGPLAFERLYPVMRAPDAPGADTPIAFDPHDMPLSILAESGALGLAAAIWAFVAFGLALRTMLSHATFERRALATALTAGMVAVLVHSLLNSVSISFAIVVQFSALALAAAQWGFEPANGGA